MPRRRHVVAIEGDAEVSTVVTRDPSVEQVAQRSNQARPEDATTRSRTVRSFEYCGLGGAHAPQEQIEDATEMVVRVVAGWRQRRYRCKATE